MHKNIDNCNKYSNYNYKTGKICIVLYNNSFQKKLCLARVPSQRGNWGDILPVTIYDAIYDNTSKLF